MRNFAQPRVIVSKCLGFARCRYNGEIISDEFVRQLQPHVTFLPICPEVEIGLGVPRDSLRVVSVDGELQLVQSATGTDLTERMRTFAHDFLSAAKDIDGFILKGRSPSCGFKDVKVYPSTEKVGPMGRSAGFFGGPVMEHFSHLAVEDEGRLKNYTLREHFMTRLFTLADFRAVKASGAMRELVRFQSENKLLLMAYSQKNLRALGRIVANPDKRPLDKVLADYERDLWDALASPPRRNSGINVLMHAMGYFSKHLSKQEKAFFLNTLERYRAHKVPLSVPIGIANAWIVRFEEPYLSQQTFFEPYPEALVTISDSGKGRPL